MDLDRRVRRGRERLSQEVEPAPPAPLSVEKSEHLSVLEEKIKNLLEQVETLGEDGKVDEAEALMRKVLIRVIFRKRFMRYKLLILPHPRQIASNHLGNCFCLTARSIMIT